MKVSVGQAACNAVSDWLKSNLTPDVTVYPFWPETGGAKLAPRAVSVISVGRRERLDVSGIALASQQNLTHGATFTYEVGHIVQPCELDLWDTRRDGRDDLIAQLDSILNSGDAAIGKTSPGSDVVSDTIAVPFRAADGFAGTIEVWLDEPSLVDTADSIARSEYRAIVLGELRCALTVQRTHARMKSPTFKVNT